MWPASIWLDSSVGRAILIKPEFFSQALISQLLISCTYNCDDKSYLHKNIWTFIYSHENSYIFNTLFPSSLVPLFQSESVWVQNILMKMSLICMKIKLCTELIFTWKVSHLDSVWNRGTRELGNGPLKTRQNINQDYLAKNMITALTFTFTSLFGSQLWLSSFVKSLSPCKAKCKILVAKLKAMLKLLRITGPGCSKPA